MGCFDVGIDIALAPVFYGYSERGCLVTPKTEDWIDQFLDDIADALATIWPFSWFDAILRGPVRPK